MSPTQRTLAKLKMEGWTVQVVEKWNPHARIRQDFLGIIDIIALRGDRTLGVQCTTLSNLGPRVQKITESEHIGTLRDAGWNVEAWGWRKLKSGWEPKIVDLS